MPIKETSFRIGCGRYLQEPGILRECGAEVARLGHAPLIIGGKTALSLTREQIQSSIEKLCTHYRIEQYCGSCNEIAAKEFAELAKKECLDVIVGVGGGVIMDLAKLIAHHAELPLINIPTSSATCAAYTPLSILYAPDGRTTGSMHYKREINAVIADTAIISTQPPRLLLAGMFDGLAKFVEIKHRFNSDFSSYPLGLDWAYVLSRYSYEQLCEKAEPCLSDMQKAICSDTVEQFVFAAIAATGVISNITRSSNQAALAHKFYETTRILFLEESKPYLHGEIVGVGLLLQNHFNGETENNPALLELMQKYNMPSRISEVGIKADAQTMEKYFELMKKSSAITENSADAPEKLHKALEYLWAL